MQSPFGFETNGCTGGLGGEGGGEQKLISLEQPMHAAAAFPVCAFHPFDPHSDAVSDIHHAIPELAGVTYEAHH